jgi:hypothetical protein
MTTKFQMLHKALRHDPRHHHGGGVHTLAPAVSERDRGGVGEVFPTGRLGDYVGRGPGPTTTLLEASA